VTGARDRALGALPALAPRWIEALGRMIACDTTFPPGAGYAAFADLMERDQLLVVDTVRTHLLHASTAEASHA